MSEEVALRYFFCFIPVCFRLHPLCPPGGGKGPRITPPYLALRLCVRCPPVPTKASLSEQAGAHIHPRMGGGMKLRQGYYPLCVPRPAVGGIAGGCMERGSGPPLFFCFIPVCSDSISCALRAGERGLLWGRCPPSRPLSTPESPPVPRAEALCSLPACSNQSFAFGTGGRTHPSSHGGRHEVRPRVLPFVRTPSRRRRDCRRVA